ncbi:MAG: hypothetical protein IT258_13675 [Saprospiraceae bacterium]|nr:hypothetical protein [Saprospiraceae bacterium]
MTVESRLSPLKRFATLAVIALLIWSAALESAFFYTGFVEMFGNLPVVITVTTLLVLLLEGAKFYFGAFAFRFLVQGWLKEGWTYWMAFLIVIPLCIAVYFGSIYLNINGAPQIAVFFTSRTVKPALEILDATDAYYDARQATLAVEKENALSIKRKGKPTDQATVLLSQIQEQSNRIEIQRDSALARAQRQNTMLLSQSTSKTKEWGTWLSRFGGFGEGLTLFFLLFIEVYDKARQAPSEKQTTKRKPANASHRQKIRQIDTANHAQELVAAGVWYENKSYPPSRFKDWLDKVEHRSRESATASARLRNSQRHAEMLASWDSYIGQAKAE